MPVKIRIITITVILLLTSASAGHADVRPTAPVTIRVLTLDDRPPNSLFLKQLAAIAGIDIEITFDPGAAIDADIVSLNTAVAGSLVGSRTADPRTLIPPEIKPDALIHFAVPRAQPTVRDETALAEYNRVIQELQNPDVQREVIDAINSGMMIEDPYLREYIDRILGWIDLLDRAAYDPDRLLITLDDNRPGPLSAYIRQRLSRYSRYVHDGTDEGMMLCLARALRERMNDPELLCPFIYTSAQDLLQFQPLESSVAFQNILLMSNWLDVQLVSDHNLCRPWTPVLWVHGRSSESDDEFRTLISRILNSTGDERIIIADIARTNGGDEALIDAMASARKPENLIGYLAWNTSSNTLGSAMALWACIDFAYEHSADPEGVDFAVEVFLWSRFLDDYLYQTVTRPEVTTAARDSGYDIYNLTDDQAERLSGLISSGIRGFWSQYSDSPPIPLRFIDATDSTSFTIELPWNRLFEISLYISDERGVLPTINPL